MAAARLPQFVELNRDTRGLRHASCVEEELASCQLHQWFHSALLYRSGLTWRNGPWPNARPVSWRFFKGFGSAAKALFFILAFAAARSKVEQLAINNQQRITDKNKQVRRTVAVQLRRF